MSEWVCDWCGRTWKRIPTKPCASCEKEGKGLGSIFYIQAEAYFVFKKGKLLLDRVCDAETHKIYWKRKESEAKKMKCKNCGHELIEEKGKYKHKTSDYKKDRCMALLGYTSDKLFYCNCTKPVPEKEVKEK